MKSFWKNLSLLILLCCVAQSTIFALTVEISNNSNISVNVMPLWTNGPKDWVLLGKGRHFHRYNSHLHHIQGLQVVRQDDRSCWYTYNLEGYNLRGLGTINLIIGDNDRFDTVHIQGKTGLRGQELNFYVDKVRGSCNK